MRGETVALLNMADAIPGYGREAFLQDVELLIMQKKFFTCEELSSRYGVSIQTIKNWEASGQLLPDLRIGKGCVRYSAAVVAEFEKNNPGKRETVGNGKGE
jgi:hypothetical protein